MTTAQTIVDDAFAAAGLAEDGQSTNPNDAAYALRVLNRMLGKWSNMRLLFPVLTEYSVTLTGLQTYTIGPTGAVTGLRPIKINAATATDAAGVEYPVAVITRAQWDCIAVKNVTGGPPSDVWYEATATDGTVNVYPKASGYTLNLKAQALLASFPTVGTAVTLPDGYEEALVLSLADALCASYSQPTPGDVLRRMAGAVRAIKRTNTEPILNTHELAGYGGSGFIIERGY